MVENKGLILSVGILVIVGLYLGMSSIDLIGFFSSWLWLIVCGIALLVLIGYLVFSKS